MDLTLDAVREALKRRAAAVVSVCDAVRLDRREDGGIRARNASRDRVCRLVSFFVRYILDQPTLREEFKRLVGLDLVRFNSPPAKRVRGEIERMLGVLLQPLNVSVSRAGAGAGGHSLHLSTSPMSRAADYRNALSRLDCEAVDKLPAPRRNRLLTLQRKCLARVSDYEKLVSYDVDYEGGESAQLLLRVHSWLDPAHAMGVRNVKPWLRQDEFDGALYYSDPRGFSLAQVRSAALEVSAILDARLDGQLAKAWIVDRLAAYVQLYAGKRIRDGIIKLSSRQRKSPKVEEQVLRPIIEEFIFYHGYYALTEAQLGADRLRPDILMEGEAAWFLFELKQCGFGKAEKTSAAGIERKLQEAVWKAERYHTLLSPLKGVQPDIYVICFVNGTAEFAGADGAFTGYGHDLSQAGVRFHLRIVNLPPSNDRTKRLRVRTASLVEASGQDAALRIAASGPLRHSGRSSPRKS